MKEIPLTQGKVAVVDDTDYPLLNLFRWHAHKNQNGNWYACRNILLDNKRTIELMHRAILIPLRGMCIDHRDGDGLNNQRHNLRIATKTQNGQNGKPYKNKRYRGVHWYKARAKFTAQIIVNGKQVHLGYFWEAESAAQAYNVAALKYFGEFARLNEIGG